MMLAEGQVWTTRNGSVVRIEGVISSFRPVKVLFGGHPNGEKHAGHSVGDSYSVEPNGLYSGHKEPGLDLIALHQPDRQELKVGDRVLIVGPKVAPASEGMMDLVGRIGLVKYVHESEEGYRTASVRIEGEPHFIWNYSQLVPLGDPQPTTGPQAPEEPPKTILQLLREAS